MGENCTTIWWTSAEAAHAVILLQQMMDAAEAGDIDQHVTPALGIAIDAIQILEHVISNPSPEDEEE